MTSARPPAPDRTGTVADFVRALTRLRQWAGEPSLSRLRSLGGQVVASDGATVDALPKSTTSHVLKQTGRLPRWDFVRAFVTACLRFCDHPEELVPAELERWRAARDALAGPPPDAGEPDPEPMAGDRAEDPAVALLARRVAREEDRARRGLLGGYSVAPVAFTAPGGTEPGDVPSIARYFAGLRPRRLLVVGESGSGKTVLAIELVLRLVEPLVAADGRFAGRPPVPVRLSAARWTAGTPFPDWFAGELARDYGLGAKDAARLVRDRRVLPVVDGLEELDPEPATGPPRRAIGLLAELNRYSDLSGRRPAPVVVTCRADRHAELTAARAGLDNAARIHLQDLTVPQIGAYLHARWPDGHPCGRRRTDILAALAGPSGAAVHAALATPWRLMLTATAVESGADPAELLRAAPDADLRAAAASIARRLLDAYVPAATGLTPRGAHRTPYRPEQVRSWLEHLAGHLRWQAAHADRPVPGLTAIDIVPHLLWPIGGRRRVLALHGLACLLFAVVAMLAFWTGSAVDRPGDLRGGLDRDEGLTLALMAAWVAIATRLSLARWPAAAGGRANVPVRLRLAGGLIGVLSGAPVGLLAGLAGLALTRGAAFDPGFAAAAGVAGGAVLGAVIGVTAAGRHGAGYPTASAVIRAEPVTLLGFGLCGALTGLPPLRLAHAGPVPLATGIAGTFVLACALGIAFKFAAGGWSKDADLAHPREALRRNPAIGVAFGLVGGVAAFLVFLLSSGVLTALACALVGGVTFGLAFGAVAWSRTMIGLLVAAARGLLPLRLWTFLDWACEARLLRVSGATYQFRHRELQDFLTGDDAAVKRP